MPSLDEVYCKFGNASEAAQLLETELGNLLLESGAIDANLFAQPDVDQARSLLTFINRQTLGQLLNGLNRSTKSLSHLELLLSKALKERNRLTHSFYRQHNFRRNSEEGRTIMLEDLEIIHQVILDAYKEVMLQSGIDLDKSADETSPTTHLPL